MGSHRGLIRRQTAAWVFFALWVALTCAPVAMGQTPQPAASGAPRAAATPAALSSSAPVHKDATPSKASPSSEASTRPAAVNAPVTPESMEPKGYTDGAEINYTHHILITLFWLAVMGLLIYGTARYLQTRLGMLGLGGTSRRGIQVIDRYVLGPQKALMVVRVPGRVLLLGMTEQNINLITELSPEDYEADAATALMSPTAKGAYDWPPASSRSAAPRKGASNPPEGSTGDPPSATVIDMASLFGRKSGKGDDSE